MTSDEGLTKQGLLEVQNIVKMENESLRDDFRREIKKITDDQTKQGEEMSKFRKKTFESFDKIGRDILGIEFKHNWKTALWVFAGAATPVVLQLIYGAVK